MLLGILFAGLILCGALPWIYFKKSKSKNRARNTILGNIVCFALVIIAGIAVLFTGDAALAEGTVSDSGTWAGYLGAAISTGLACIGAGYAVAQGASAALGAISENENLTGKALIFVALAEGIALYGMVIAIIILNKF